jgi:hypothetical protein
MEDQMSEEESEGNKETPKKKEKACGTYIRLGFVM